MLTVIKTTAYKSNEEVIRKSLYPYRNSIYGYGEITGSPPPGFKGKRARDRTFYRLILIFEGEYTVDLKNFLDGLFANQIIGSFEVLK